MKWITSWIKRLFVEPSTDAPVAVSSQPAPIVAAAAPSKEKKEVRKEPLPLKEYKPEDFLNELRSIFPVAQAFSKEKEELVRELRRLDPRLSTKNGKAAS